MSERLYGECKLTLDDLENAAVTREKILGTGKRDLNGLLIDRIRELEEALEFYSNKQNYYHDTFNRGSSLAFLRILNDDGAIARKALSAEPSGKPNA